MPSGSPPSLYEHTHYVLHSTHRHLQQLICVPVKPLHAEGEQAYLTESKELSLHGARRPGGIPELSLR